MSPVARVQIFVSFLVYQLKIAKREKPFMERDMAREFVIAAWVGCACCIFPAGVGRADFESDLLHKFRNQNKACADRLSQEAARLLSVGNSPVDQPEKTREPLRKLLGQLQEDMHLPRADRETLIRKVQDRLRDCKNQTEKDAPKTFMSKGSGVHSIGERFAKSQEHGRLMNGPPSSSVSERDPNVKVKQGTFVVINPGRIVVPDGGVSSLGGFSYLAETRNEYGVPGLRAIPYLGRAFRNVSTSRMSGGLQISTSVRIISMQEEEGRFLGR